MVFQFNKTIKSFSREIVANSHKMFTRGRNALQNTTRKIKKDPFLKAIENRTIASGSYTPSSLYNIFYQYSKSSTVDSEKDKTYLFYKNKVEQDILMEYKKQKLVY